MSQLKPLLQLMLVLRAPNGIRTRVTAVKGQRPRPLDDGGKCLLVKGTRLKHTGKLVNQAKQIGPIKATASRRTNEELSAVTRFGANTSRS